MYDLSGRTAIVTGSTSGIGLSIADFLAKCSANVVINGLGDESKINSLIEELKLKNPNSKVIYSPARVDVYDEFAQMVKAAEDEFGTVDILVNNAGIQFVAEIENFPIDRWQEVINLNLSAAFYGIKCVIAGMKKRNWGRIINISSAHGLVSSAKKSAYVSAKHGIIGLTKTAALEAANYNITVNAICPGWVDTPLVRKQIESNAETQGISISTAEEDLIRAKHPNGRFVNPADIAAMVAFLSGEYSASITGAAISIDGGWTAQ